MEVTVYSTATCPYCQMEKAYLRERGINFRDVLVDQDRAGLEELVKISGQLGVPFTAVKKDDIPKYVLGFDQAVLDELLEIG
jgi:glutaredoxin